jgi:hypothetical protein
MHGATFVEVRLKIRAKMMDLRPFESVEKGQNGDFERL